MTPLQITLLIVVICIVILMTVYFLRVENQKKIDDRLARIGSKNMTRAKAASAQDKNTIRADLAKKLKESEQQEKKKKRRVLAERLQNAGFEATDIFKFWIASFASCLIGVMIFKLMGLSGLPLILIGITFFFGVPRFVLTKLIQRRQKKFLDEFADALESMMRLLKAGMPVGEAIAMVAREYGGPVGEEMMRVYNEQKIGIPLSEAVQKAAERMPLTEMQMFATGITIQQQTGSSLSEILQNLATVIRARYRLKRKVQALSAEAKASAGIIGALPVLVALGLYFINPEYIMLLFITKPGKMLLTGAVVWMAAGVFVMKQMINFKV